MNDIQALQKEIAELASAWGEFLKTGDHRKANKQNSAITKVVKRFRNNRELGESVLGPLLKHPNPSVRLLASVHALDLEIKIQEAEENLIKIAGDPTIRVIRLMAQINLDKWNKKKN